MDAGFDAAASRNTWPSAVSMCRETAEAFSEAPVGAGASGGDDVFAVCADCNSGTADPARHARDVNHDKQADPISAAAPGVKPANVLFVGSQADGSDVTDTQPRKPADETSPGLQADRRKGCGFSEDGESFQLEGIPYSTHTDGVQGSRLGVGKTTTTPTKGEGVALSNNVSCTEGIVAEDISQRHTLGTGVNATLLCESLLPP